MLSIIRRNLIRRAACAGAILLAPQVCPASPPPEAAKAPVYQVRPCARPPVIDADWTKEFWSRVPALGLENHMGDKPDPFPDTRVKMCYDKDALYLIFRVEERHVRAVAVATHGAVWKDSCVEFFLSPWADSKNGYFNLETNCKGVFLFQSHDFKNKTARLVASEDCAKIQIAHSLTADTTEEIPYPVVWTLEYRVPLAVLGKYLEFDPPHKGTRWRANFYKCADASSHPHWLTWARVVAPQPNFHLPEFFGGLEFE